jgi:broad specificity phosphatase PhoE
MRFNFRFALAFALLSMVSGAAIAQPSTVILVRHAERASQETDSPLNEAGMQRAKDLATALADAGVTAVVTSQYQRTKLTAASVVEATKAPNIVVANTGNTPTHIADVAAAVRARPAGDIVLVVGHSNTIPAIVGALGGPKMDSLCDSQHSMLYILEMNGSKPPRLIRSNYGAADPPDPTCKRMMK